MKNNKNYHGAGNAAAESGYTDAMAPTTLAPSEPSDGFPVDLTEENRGFLDRDNVFKRL